MGNPEDAADGLQDGLVAAYRRAGSFRGEAAVTTWLHRVVVNACLDRIRAAKVRRAEALPDDLDEHARPRVARDRDRRQPTTRADRGRATSGGARCSRPWRTLPADQRAALVLVDMEGYPVAEVAVMLDCAVGTVKSRCSRGRARLAELLGVLAPGGDAGPRRPREPRPVAARPIHQAPRTPRPGLTRPTSSDPETTERRCTRDRRADDPLTPDAGRRYAASSPTRATPSRCLPTSSARLDRVLADLADEPEPARRRPSSTSRARRRRRRAALLVAAAAVVVVGVGVGQVVRTAGQAATARQRPRRGQRRRGGRGASATRASRATSATARRAPPAGRRSPGEASVAGREPSGAPRRASPRPAPGPATAPERRRGRRHRQAAATDRVSRAAASGDLGRGPLVPVTYGGSPAVLVLPAPRGRHRRSSTCSCAAAPSPSAR